MNAARSAVGSSSAPLLTLPGWPSSTQVIESRLPVSPPGSSDDPGPAEGASDSVAPPDELVPAPPQAASSKLTVATNAAYRHLRRCIGVPTSIAYAWREAGRRIGQDETDQDSLPMRRPTGAVLLPARRVSQAEQITAGTAHGFILTERCRSAGG